MDELEARVEALERAVTDGDHDLSALAAAGETSERLTTIEAELGELTDRVAELEAATQALRGYVGNVRAVNRDVEQRADAALARAESIERALVGDGSAGAEGGGVVGESSPADGAGTRSGGERDATAEATGSGNRTGPPGDPGGNHGNHTPSGDRPGEPNQPDRCRACGQRTAGQRTGNGQTPGSGREFPPETTASTQAQETESPLDSVFEAGETQNGDSGAFERIRQML